MVSTAEVLHGRVRFRRVCFEAGSPALSRSTDLSMGHHLEGRELCMTVSFRDALPYRPDNLDATSYHGRSGISKGPMGQKSWENAFLRDTPDHSSHLPCPIGEFSTAKNVRLFIASAATYWGDSHGNMEPRFGLRCRGAVRCLCVPVRFLKSCLHYCDWTEDALARKLRCNRFMRFAVSCGRCRRGIGRVRHLQRSLGLLRCGCRPASAQPVGAVRHKKQKKFFRASIFFHALSFLPRTARALDKKSPCGFSRRGLNSS